MMGGAEKWQETVVGVGRGVSEGGSGDARWSFRG